MIDEIFKKFDGAFADNTIRAYRSDFEQYSKWCATKKNVPPIPATADNLALYVDELSHTCKSATIRRRVNSLGTIFKLSKNADPTKDPEVVLALKRMHRKIGRHQKQATPLTRDHLEQLLANCSNDLRGLRNRVLLQLGYETMRRRSELCNFRFEDLSDLPHGRSSIRLVKSKTDQQGIAKLIPISTSLRDLIKEWQTTYDLRGFILRSVDQHGNISASLNSGSFNVILRRLINDLELKNKDNNFSGHSFRVGAAVDLLAAGASIETIMLRGGWRHQDTAMDYLRSW